MDYNDSNFHLILIIIIFTISIILRNFQENNVERWTQIDVRKI